MSFKSVAPVAVVSGGTGGIGWAVVEGLCVAGYAVVVLDRHPLRAHAWGDQILQPVQLDLSVAANVARAIDRVAGAVDRVDVLVNCAATSLMQDPRDTTVADFDSVMATNVRTPWQLTVGLLPLVIRGTHRSVVNIGSTHPHQTKAGSFPYNVSKGALQTLTKALAVDLGDLGIRVNTVAPGFIATPRAKEWLNAQPDPQLAWQTVVDAHPTGRAPTEEDVASAVVFLASLEAKGISSCEIVVDGGRAAMRA